MLTLYWSNQGLIVILCCFFSRENNQSGHEYADQGTVCGPQFDPPRQLASSLRPWPGFCSRQRSRSQLGWRRGETGGSQQTERTVKA